MLLPSTSPDAPPSLTPAPCAICGEGAPSSELYPANFSPSDLNPTVFSARRVPDRIHYRLMRCDQCTLVRSDPVASPELLANVYRDAGFDYSEEVACLEGTYGRVLADAVALHGGVGPLLEIGCGNGFLLDRAMDMGFGDVRGVEPSTDAIDQAPDRVRARIISDVMRPGLFDPDSFDFICLFQVFDHLPDPNAILDLCMDALRPGGMLLCLNHNVDATPARILREKCPIIDIEHTYLYSGRTMRVIMQAHGFRVLRAGSVRNLCTLDYLVHLLPLPAWVRNMAVRTLAALHAGRVRLWLPLGNIRVIAQKPRG